MANITSVVNHFLEALSALPDEGGHDDVVALLQPAIEAEQELRVQYAQQPPLPDIDAPYLGLIDVFKLSPNACRARPRPLDGVELGYRFDQGGYFLFPQHYLLPLHPFLRRTHGSPVFVHSLEDFRTNWEIFTHNALSNISDWNNIIVAGGSVLACLSPLLVPQTTSVATNDFFQSNAYSDSDIDVFLWGLTPEQAKDKMESLFTMIKQSLPWRATCVRKLNTISIHTKYPTRPIQIILRLYRSPAEILAGFDVDSACCLYDGSNVYISTRALASCVRQANNIDITRRSPSYEVRLAKYADRGFEIYLPTLDRTRLNYDYLYDTGLCTFPKGLGRLVVLELLRDFPHRYPRLYQPLRTHSRPPCEADLSYQPLDFKPVEKTLLKNNYESLWVRIPYRQDWDAERVERHVKTIDSKLNSDFQLMSASRRLHRHAAFCGTMAECLSDFCPACPVPESEEELAMLLSEATKFIRGPVQFLQSNPGQQMITGSFNPINVNDWAQDAYTEHVCDRVVSTSYFEEPEHLGDESFPSSLTSTDNTNTTDTAPPMELEQDLERPDLDQILIEDLDMLGIVEESEGEGSSYYSDAFGSDTGNLE